MRPVQLILVGIVLTACSTSRTHPPASAPVLAAPTSGTAGSSGRFAAEIAAFEAADRHTQPAPGGVLFVGSSSIRLWPSLADDFRGVPVVQRGFGGSEIS